jgi:hypothetical protein
MHSGLEQLHFASCGWTEKLVTSRKAFPRTHWETEHRINTLPCCVTLAHNIGHWHTLLNISCCWTHQENTWPTYFQKETIYSIFILELNKF